MNKKIHKCRYIRDLKDMLEQSAEIFDDKPAFVFKTDEPDKFDSISFDDYKEDVDELGTALIDLGLKDKRVAVIGENRYEWALAYMSVVAGTGVVVPLDKSLPEMEIESLIMRSDVEAIFYTKTYKNIMKRIREENKYNLKHYICMDKDELLDGELYIYDLKEKGEELLEKGNKAFVDAEIDNEKMSIMLFTSGTTSMSKAVMLSQKNICTNLMDIASVIKIDTRDTLLSFLPLHHTFECTVGFLAPIYCGSRIAYCEGIRHIADNIKDYQVTAMISVPILFENMYKKVIKGIEKQGKMEAVKKGIKISQFFLKFGIDIRRIVFKDIHAKFGGKLRLFVNGAAALDKEVEKGFNALGIKIVQGYGLTETSPVVAAGNDKYTRLGSVGKVFPSVEVKIIPDEDSEEGIGEIAVKGDSIMLGYYENDEANKNAFDEDGWFLTGDLGYFDADNFLYIVTRKKNVIVLKNGKNIYPEELENLINKVNGVKESFVYGKPDKDDDLKICAKVVYDSEIMKNEENLEGVEQIHDFLWKKIKEINKTMPAYKYIRELTITEEELIKTTTQKVKRHEEMKRV